MLLQICGAQIDDYSRPKVFGQKLTDLVLLHELFHVHEVLLGLLVFLRKIVFQALFFVPSVLGSYRVMASNPINVLGAVAIPESVNIMEWNLKANSLATRASLPHSNSLSLWCQIEKNSLPHLGTSQPLQLGANNQQLSDTLLTKNNSTVGWKAPVVVFLFVFAVTFNTQSSCHWSDPSSLYHLLEFPICLFLSTLSCSP